MRLLSAASGVSTSIVALTGRWSEAMRAVDVACTPIDVSAFNGHAQILSSARSGRKEGNVRRAGACPRRR